MNPAPNHSGPDASTGRRPGWWRRGARWAGICGIWLVVFELGAQVAVLVRPDWLQPDVSWAEAECYAGQPWVEDYFQEWWRLESRWEPYVYWRSRPFAGTYIQVSEEGIRRTWRPGAPPPDAYRILIFGGSTLWGLGARDEYTIPSLVSRLLADGAGRPVEVVNLGELGYVSTQGLVLLMRELQAGRMPDLVVFYDGVNDVFSAFQSGRPGIPQNEYRREREFNLLRLDGGRTVHLVAVAAYRVVHQSAILRMANRWIVARRPRLAGLSPDPEQTGRLAEAVHAAYARNVEMIEALAGELGFEALFYWQPSVFSKPLRSPHEEREFQAFLPLEALTLAVNQRLVACEHLQARPSFRYVADEFEATPHGVFFDYCHLGEAGNAVMAERLAGDILDLMQKGQTE